MMKDIGNMDLEQKEYICLCCLEILESLNFHHNLIIIIIDNI